MITEVLNFIFLPVLAKFGTVGFVIFMSLLFLLLTSIFMKEATQQKQVKQIKKELIKLSADLKNHIGNKEIAYKINKKIMDRNLKSASYTIIPTILVIIPMFMIFPWMSATVPGAVITIFGLEIGWIITYIILSLSLGHLLRKAIGA